jgi:hypothetical protein
MLKISFSKWEKNERIYSNFEIRKGAFKVAPYGFWIFYTIVVFRRLLFLQFTTLNSNNNNNLLEAFPYT